MGAFFGIRPIIGVVAALAIAVGFAASAQAATYTVGTTSDTTPGTLCPTFPSGCSLRQLIERENGLAATPNPADTIVVPVGAYDVSSALVIRQSVSIQGAGARTTTVKELASDRVFFVHPPSAASIPTVTISGLAISFGAATANNGSFGGNVLNQGTLTLSEDWLSSGTAQSGGGVSNEGGTLTVTHSLISGNAANSGGADSGGIQNFGPNPVTGTAGKLFIDNSTIANNTAALGGGIFSWCPGANACSSNGAATNTTTITNSTIAGNNGGSRSTTGGGLLASDGTISVENSIVAGNVVTNANNIQSASNCGSAAPGVITSLGYNLESGTDCGFTATGDLPDTDPEFSSSSPENNGGNTDTLGIALTSPAVDHIPTGAAGCGGTDQRDVVRPQGKGCDVGAFEFAQPIEGGQLSGVLAIAGCVVSSQPQPTINWGDGTTSPATVTATTGPITGSHTYTEEGTYTITVSWTDDCGPHAPTFKLVVSDAALTATATPVSTTAGTPFTGPVATFTDANSGGTVSEYSATIGWGDGATSAGAVTAGAGNFVVSGSHTYASPGTYHTTVTIKDIGGASATATGTAAAAGPPAPVITGAPVVTGPNGAAFSGTVNPNGLATSAYFQYGIPTNAQGPEAGPTFTQFTPTQTVGSDFSNHTISASAAGLVPNEFYEVRLVATNSAGTSYGPIQTFRTAQNAPPPPPVLGKQVDVQLVSGHVWIKPPPGKTLGPAGDSAALSKGQGFVPLTEARQIPTGSEVDALHGSLKIVTATGHVGKTQNVTISGGLFTLAQNRTGISKGLTNFALQEGAFQGAPSYATCKPKGKKKSADQATIAALSSKTLQLLKARAHGKFKTTGRYSSATVRGTIWTIADRCDGTLTHTIRDTVLVQDFVRHKTILLHAGHTYLARAIASHK